MGDGKAKSKQKKKKKTGSGKSFTQQGGQENPPAPVNTAGSAPNLRGSIHNYFSTKLLQAQFTQRENDPKFWTNE
jgi:hypothetical protein